LRQTSSLVASPNTEHLVFAHLRSDVGTVASLLPGAKLSEDRGLGSAIRDESLGARHPTLPGLEHRSLQEKRRVATHALNVCVPSRTAGVA